MIETAPLQSSAFRWFFAGRTVSLLGSFMSPVAIAFGVLEITGSAAWLSAVTTAVLIPMVATLLLGGGIADRHRRDTVLAQASLGSGLAQAGIAALLFTHQQPVLLLPLAALNGVMQGLATPALRGIVTNLAAGPGLQQASSLLASARNLGRIAGPATAGVLTATVGAGWAVSIDAASFLVAAACFTRIHLAGPPARAHASGMLSDLREGWRYFRSHTWIWTVTLAFAVFNATNRGFWLILGPVIAQDTIGARGWGLVLSAQGVGALSATLALARIPLMRRPMHAALLAMALAALPLILLGTGAGLLPLAAAAFLAGIAVDLFTVVWETVNYTHIPEHLLSRVGAHDEFWSTVSFPAGQLSAPLLAAVFGAPAVALTGGLVAAAVMLATSSLRPLRRIEIQHDGNLPRAR
ncbi:MFS transporter [Kineosporia succinea]|uniref:MFS family arabinose efflux permease n=1 Tax=Kineosporia succinea TaxID=84632 RepID=A0ABT9PBV8_9ACTN|nr:MFS transporter [Kineosporia succinea]MDP9830187.1 putative MFS family arabinose efflux permease [Kineosporia succinea]